MRTIVSDLPSINPVRHGPAWRVAEFTVIVLQPAEGNTTGNSLFLQIGAAGTLFELAAK
jgi:hypothetical protein